MQILRTKTASAICIVALLMASSASSGGLSDALLEENQVMAPPAVSNAPAANAAPATQGAVPNWVLPMVGLLVIGAIASAGSGSGDGGDGSSEGDGAGGPPIVIDVK